MYIVIIGILENFAVLLYIFIHHRDGSTVYIITT